MCPNLWLVVIYFCNILYWEILPHTISCSSPSLWSASSLRSEKRVLEVESIRNCGSVSSLMRIWRGTWSGSHRQRSWTMTRRGKVLKHTNTVTDYSQCESRLIGFEIWLNVAQLLSTGLLPLQKDGSETETLYELEGLNKLMFYVWVDWMIDFMSRRIFSDF